MVKIIRLDPIAEEMAVETRSNILSALLSKDLDVLKECGGRGMCATVSAGCNEVDESKKTRFLTIGASETKTDMFVF